MNEQRWIPVSERLPDEGQLCLVVFDDIYGVAWWHGDSRSFAHCDIDNHWMPTHWMPVPRRRK